jgi:hypothetical protein
MLDLTFQNAIKVCAERFYFWHNERPTIVLGTETFKDIRDYIPENLKFYFEETPKTLPATWLGYDVEIGSFQYGFLLKRKNYFDTMLEGEEDTYKEIEDATRKRLAEIKKKKDLESLYFEE